MQVNADFDAPGIMDNSRMFQRGCSFRGLQWLIIYICQMEGQIEVYLLNWCHHHWSVGITSLPLNGIFHQGSQHYKFIWLQHLRLNVLFCKNVQTLKNNIYMYCQSYCKQLQRIGGSNKKSIIFRIDGFSALYIGLFKSDRVALTAIRKITFRT